MVRRDDCRADPACVADDENEKLSKQIIAIIEDAGPEGIPPSILVRKKGLGKKPVRLFGPGFEDQIKDSGAIFFFADKKKGWKGQGKPSVRWVAVIFYFLMKRRNNILRGKQGTAKYYQDIQDILSGFREDFQDFSRGFM